MHKRPSYFDPDIIGSEKNALGLYSTPTKTPKSSVTAAAPRPPSTPPPPLPKAALPVGWYAAADEATGKEYYYTAEGAVTWERPQ